MRFATLVLLLSSTLTLFAADEPPQVLILGTFHFANPGLDFVKSEVPDVLAPERQKEIAEVAAKLKKFAPTKVVVEVPLERQAALTAEYAAYRAGKRELTRNEVDQLGYRIANELGHETVYAIDVKGPMDIGGVMAFAQKNDPAFMATFANVMKELIEPQTAMQKEKPIGETLRWMNEPARVAFGHRVYVDMARVGDATNYIGAEQAGVWWLRNFKIFANLARLAKPNERVLVIYGGGHVALLQEFGRAAGWKVVEANEFL